MVGTMRVALLAIAFAVAGCYDKLYGPKLTNAYGFDVVVTVEFEVGRSVTTQWPACRTVFFGSKQEAISRLEIKRDGKTLQSLSAEEVRDLARALEASRGRVNWMVDSSGIHRAAGDATCKPAE